MKKLLSIALVLMMLVVLAVPAFAAAPTKADLEALAAKAPAQYQAQIKAVIAQMTDAQAAAVNVPALVATAKDLQAKQAAGTLTGTDVVNAATAMQAIAGVGIDLEGLDITDGKTVSVVVKATVPGKAPVGSEYNVSNAGTSTSTGVIKATGMSAATAALALALAISGVFGFAVIKSRKVAA